MVSEAAGTAAARPAPASARRRWLRWTGRVLMFAAVGASVVMIRDDLPDLTALWHVARDASPAWLAWVVVGQLASMGMFARVQRRLLHAGGARMSLPHALRMTYAGNALSSTLPVGPAISVGFNFRQYRRAGASPQVATAVVLMGGVIMTTAYTVVGLVALLAEPHARFFAGSALAGLAGAVAAIALAWRRHGRTLMRAARWVARPALRRPAATRLIAQFHQGRGTLRLGPGDWCALTAMALANWLFDILSLDAAGRAVGVHAALYAITLAYFAAQAAGSLFPLLPGGLGAIEGSLTASLVAFGALAVPAGVAVALYRLVSFWGVVAAGWLAWLAVKLGEEGPDGPLRTSVRRGVHTAGASLAATSGLAPYAPASVPAADPVEPV